MGLMVSDGVVFSEMPNLIFVPLASGAAKHLHFDPVS